MGDHQRLALASAPGALALASRPLRPPGPRRHSLEHEASPRGAGPTRAWTWPALMRRVFDFDVFACPRCGARLPVIATVQDLPVVQAILAHLVPFGVPRPRHRTPLPAS